MNAQLIEWNDLYLILAVCREGTLSGAARVLGVNHSTVFRRIGAIEEKVGTRLFERLATGYVMTDAAEAILESGERIENEVHRLSRKLIGRDYQLNGVIRLAVPDALLSQILMRHLAGFSKLYPQIQIELEISNSYLNLTKREADIAIRVTESPPENLVGRKICSIGATIYAMTEIAQNFQSDNLDTISWVMPDEVLARLPVTKWLQQHYPAASVALRCNTLLGMYDAVRNGLGVAALPCFLADTDKKLHRLLPLQEELASELWMLTHQDLKRTARVKAFMDYFSEVLQDDKALLEGKVKSIL